MDNLRFREATRDDVPAIVRLLADDVLGATRERFEEGRPVDEAYLQAFDAISAQKDNRIIVAELDGRVVGTLQLTFIPGLSRLGLVRAQIEEVRVASTARGQGIGEKLISYAIDRARDRGCGLVQLTTDNTRTDAHRFYERLGFVASHVGMKLVLS